MKPFPIRWKLALWSAGLAVSVLVIFCAATFFNLYDEQIEAVDADLEAVANNLLQAGHSPGSAELRQVQPWISVAVFNADGSLRSQDGKLPEELARLALDATSPRTVLQDDCSWRILSRTAPGYTLSLGYDLSEVKDINRDLVEAYLVSVPLVVMLAALGGWWIAGRTLRPLRALAEEASTIGTDRLSHRVSLPPAEDELRRLASGLNAMLERLETGFEQTRRFSADASHELRTPLTIMAGEIERLLHAPGLSPDQEKALLSLQEEISHLSQLTENLLLLSRLDAGGSIQPLQRLDLSLLVNEACEDGGLLADLHQLHFSHAVKEGLCVLGDSSLLRRVLLNLLDNACRHNRSGGRVDCILETDEEGRAVLRIANSGDPIPSALQARLFERFFRADKARGDGGHGLGLSLCREIALVHAGSLRLSRSDEHLTEFELRLPLAGPDQSP